MLQIDSIPDILKRLGGKIKFIVKFDLHVKFSLHFLFFEMHFRMAGAKICYSRTAVKVRLFSQSGFQNYSINACKMSIFPINPEWFLLEFIDRESLLRGYTS